jgi:3-oxoacyl-[acyl-carrier-protein] synthase-3
MKREKSQIGLVSYGIYLPQTFETAEEVAARSGLSREEVVFDLGIQRKCKPSDADQPVPMALRAALDALEGAPEVEPSDIDVVIWTGEEYKDYVAQTASIRIQEEVGARNAWAFDMVGQGVTSLIGLRTARNLMIGDTSVRTVLLVGGTRNIDLVDYTNPNTRWLLATSASGGAMVLRRGHPSNHLLGMAVIVDYEMADQVYVPGGGTVHPFSPKSIGTTLMYYHTPHPQTIHTYLNNRFSQGLVEVIRRAKGGGNGVDYLALRHLNPRDRARVLKEFNLSPEQSASLENVGHHGPNDPLISLDLALKEGRIHEGSRVVLAAAGIGFTYAAVQLVWG